jgi:biopolymer transport protein ExbB
MWPILIVSIIASPSCSNALSGGSAAGCAAIPNASRKSLPRSRTGDVAEASRLSRGSRDPVLRMMWNGLNHQHASLQGALQVAAGIEIKRAGRFLVVMDTLVTLAPLLGLLGTITGLMKSFSFLGNEELAVQAVTGGIAEALIATACGLGIAIFSLIPFNFFTSRVSNLEFELQTAATNLEVMLEAQSKAREEAATRRSEIQRRHASPRPGPQSRNFHARQLTHPAQESADRDHSFDRHHVLSARQLHDGELEPGAHEGDQGESAHR